MSEVHGSSERRPEGESVGSLEHQARMGERLEAAYAEMAEQPTEPKPESSEAADPVESYKQIIKGEPGSFDRAIHEPTEGQRITVSFEPGRLVPPPIEVSTGEADELVHEEVGDYLKYDLPDFGMDPRERGKPTTLIVIGDRGIQDRIVSGVDERSPKVEEIIAELGLRPSSERIDTHAEAKLLIDMAEGRLPNHVTGIINNQICGPSPKPWVVSCDALLQAAPPRLRELHGDEYSIRIYNHDMTGHLYKDGRKHDSPPR